MFYFFGVAAVHMIGVKVPLLYIYFNIPSAVYQDRIISILSMGWFFFFLGGYSDLPSTKNLQWILCAGATALLGLAVINFATDFQKLSTLATPSLYWAQWAVLLCYFGWLLSLFLYCKSAKE
jgi:hypothetical protein